MRHRLIRRRPTATLPQGEAGFVLIITLAVMMVTMILITALLTLTVSTQRIEDTGREREHEIRAAEAAINTAINQIRNTPTMAAPVPWTPGAQSNVNHSSRMGPCEPVDGLLDIEGVPTRVSCTNQGSWPPSPPLSIQDPDRWIPADNGGPSLRLVGDPYMRGWVDKNVMPWDTAIGDPFFNDSLNPVTVAGSQPSLVHTGQAPLRVVGGLEARHQIVALRDPLTAKTQGDSQNTPLNGGPDAEPFPYGEAVEVTGYARQGGPGLYNGSTGNAGCGVGSPASSWGVQSSMVTSTSDVDPSTDGFACDDAALINGDGSGLFPGAGDWNHADTLIAKRTVPANCNDIRSNGVVQLDAGAYDAEATAVLNNWFTGGCPNTTFWFVPGDYWFDVHDPTNSDPDLRATLRFGTQAASSDTSNWVFGAPGAGWNPAAGRPNPATFPSVCNPNERGANIVLSSRSGLWHSNGRVAVCGPRAPAVAFSVYGCQGTTSCKVRRTYPTGPRPNESFEWNLGSTTIVENSPAEFDFTFPSTGTVPITVTRRVEDGAGAVVDQGAASGTVEIPAGGSFGTNLQPVHNTAFWQRTSVPLGNRLSATTPTVAGGWTQSTPTEFFGDVRDRQDSRSVRTAVPIPSPVAPWSCWIWGGCGPFDSSFQLTGFTNAGRPDPGPAPIDNAFIDLTSDTQLSNWNGSRIRFDLALTGGATCTQQYAGLPTNQVTRTYDLFATGNDVGGQTPCRDVITDRAQLAGASLTVSVRMVNPPGSNRLFSGESEIFFEIDEIALRTGWSPTVATVSSTGDGDGIFEFTDPAGAVEIGDGSVAEVLQNCFTNFWIFCSADGSWFESSIDFVDFQDPTLQDGFLPLDSVTVGIRLQAVNSLREHSNQPLVPGVLTLGPDLSDPAAPRCFVDLTYAQLAAASLTNPITVDLITGIDEPTDPCGAILKDAGDLLDLDMKLLLRANSECWTDEFCDYGWEVDGVTVQATTLGYDKPVTPFRVRWSPYAGANAGQPGDASFHVVGSTSIATNDVEVDFDGNGRPTGQPLFVGGNNRPGLVAGALATRATVGAWPDFSTHDIEMNDLSGRLPDPISSNGATRPPTRRVLLTACVIDNPGAPVDEQRLVRRAAAEVDIRDAASGGALVPGRTVTIRRWAVNVPGGAVETGADAATENCPVLSAWP